MSQVRLLIQGAASAEDVPGIAALEDDASVAYAPDGEALAAQLGDAEVVLGWNFWARDLQKCWPRAERLRWIQWCGAGVDGLLFPALRESDVTVTNARGIFDRPMAEYVIGLILAQAKGLPQTLASQASRKWDYRITEKVSGKKVAVIGIGSIGREIAELLSRLDFEVEGVGRSARGNVPVFGSVHAISDRSAVASRADWVVAILPETPDTKGLFDAEFFAAMPGHARFINLGRGSAVDEAALVAALDSGAIAGAALDVFDTEPLSEDDPLWTASNIIVSPHMSGDYHGHRDDLVKLFLDNMKRYAGGEPLLNVVDKKAGFVTS